MDKVFNCLDLVLVTPMETWPGICGIRPPRRPALALNAAFLLPPTFPLPSFLIKKVLYAISWRGCGALGFVGALGGWGKCDWGGHRVLGLKW
jgi:hypothetical protein